MIWVARLLRVALAGACLTVLSGIVPISLDHFRTGNACPNLGPIPACYLVSASYMMMAVAVLIWSQKAIWLFVAGAAPVILLASIGTYLELTGRPTCPRSDSGWPLCFSSLFVGVSMLLTFAIALLIERRRGETA